MSRLGIVVSHPIQYYSPLFRYLAGSIDLVVLYCHNPTEDEIGRDGFGKKFSWDIDLLSGYSYVFLNNISKKPSLSKFKGCDTPEIGKAFVEHKITHVLILGWYLKSYLQALQQAKKLKLKVAVRGDSQINPGEAFYKRLIKKTLYRFLLRKYDTIFYVGKRNKEYLLAYGAKETQLIFSPHAIDQEFWQRKTDEARKMEHSKTIFIWIGKFISKKRPEDVVLAFIEVYKVNPETELWMIGSGSLLDSCISRAENHPGIQFLGFKNQEELKLIAAKADILLLCSDYGETWGLVVNECFSLGIPAIVSDACGVSADLIVNGKTGCTYPLGNITELENKMLLLIEKIKNKTEFPQNIKEKNEIYSYEQNASAVKLFLRQVE